MTLVLFLEKGQVLQIEPNEYGIVQVTPELINGGYLVAPAGTPTLGLRFATMPKYVPHTFELLEGDNVFIRAEDKMKLVINVGTIV